MGSSRGRTLGGPDSEVSARTAQPSPNSRVASWWVHPLSDAEVLRAVTVQPAGWPLCPLLQIGRWESLPMMSDSDAALVARTLAGDLDAYTQLIARYRDTLGRYAVYMVGNREDAQEAMQDSFYRAYRSLRECRQPERFGAWL